MREDIKKRREKYNIQTPAMKLFGGKEMIIERKPGMPKAQYDYMRDVQQRALKMLFKRSPDRRVAALMRPTIPSSHLQLEVAKRKALKEGRLEEVVPVEGWSPSKIFTRLFNFFREITAQNDGRKPIPQPI